MRQVFLLTLKDLFLYRVELLLSWVGILGVTYAAFKMRAPESYIQGLHVISIFNLIWLMGFGEWLTHTERSSGGLAWLRTLPIPDKAIVTGKFLTNGIAQSLSFFPPLLILSKYQREANVLATASLFLGLLCIGCLMLFTKLTLSRRLGPVVPLLVVFLGIIAWGQVSRRAPEVAMALVAVFVNPVVLVTTEIMAILVVWFVMWKWIASRDTYQLVD